MKNKEPVTPSLQKICDEFYEKHVQIMEICQFRLSQLMANNEYDQAQKVMSLYLNMLGSLHIFFEVSDDH